MHALPLAYEQHVYHLSIAYTAPHRQCLHSVASLSADPLWCFGHSVLLLHSMHETKQTPWPIGKANSFSASCCHLRHSMRSVLCACCVFGIMVVGELENFSSNWMKLIVYVSQMWEYKRKLRFANMKIYEHCYVAVCISRRC